MLLPKCVSFHCFLLKRETCFSEVGHCISGLDESPLKFRESVVAVKETGARNESVLSVKLQA